MGLAGPETPCNARTSSSASSFAAGTRSRHPAPRHPPIQTSVSHATTTPPFCASYFSPWPTHAARRHSRRRRAATPSRLHAMHPALPHRNTAISTPVDYACRGLPPRPNHGPNQPLGRRFGPLRSRAAAEQGVPASRAAPTRPIRPGRPISDGRPRLEPKPFRSKPSDLDPTAENRAYPFGLALFLKRPSSFAK